MFLPYKITSTQISELTKGHLLNRTFLNQYDSLKGILYSNLDINIIKERLIQGTRLQEQWFPTDPELMKFDVFISHSHKDDDNHIKPLASWLWQHLGLKSFIDSQFWQYADDLLKRMDDWYAKKNSGNYDYGVRNYTTSHVHAMLSMALMRMMSNTECVLFVDSDNSIKYDKGQAKTPSPWIYEEICYANNLEIKIPQRYINQLMPLHESGGVIKQRMFCSREENPELTIQYKVNLDDFYEIKVSDLRADWNGGNRNTAALDYLHKKALAKYKLNGTTRRKLFE